MKKIDVFDAINFLKIPRSFLGHIFTMPAGTMPAGIDKSVLDKLDRWFLPFDKCSLFPEDLGVRGGNVMLVIEPTRDRSVTLMLKFIFYFGKVKLTGSVQLIDKITHEQANDTNYIRKYVSSNVKIVSLDVLVDSKKYSAALRVYDIVDNLGRRSLFEEIHQVPHNARVKNILDGICRTTFGVGVEALAYFGSLIADHKNVVVESQRATRRRGDIKVSERTSTFMIMSTKRLREKYIPHASGTKLKVGYECRRHTRTFRSERFVNAKGKTIVIEPHWVGPTDHFSEEKSRLYKVRLDIGGEPLTV